MLPRSSHLDSGALFSQKLAGVGELTSSNYTNLWIIIFFFLVTQKRLTDNGAKDRRYLYNIYYHYSTTLEDMTPQITSNLGGGERA